MSQEKSNEENASNSLLEQIRPPPQTTAASSTRATSANANDAKASIRQTNAKKLLSLKQVLNVEHVFEPILINYVIRQMINDPDPGMCPF